MSFDYGVVSMTTKMIPIECEWFKILSIISESHLIRCKIIVGKGKKLNKNRLWCHAKFYSESSSNDYHMLQRL